MNSRSDQEAYLLFFIFFIAATCILSKLTIISRDIQYAHITLPLVQAEALVTKICETKTQQKIDKVTSFKNDKYFIATCKPNNKNEYIALKANENSISTLSKSWSIKPSWYYDFFDNVGTITQNHELKNVDIILLSQAHREIANHKSSKNYTVTDYEIATQLVTKTEQNRIDDINNVLEAKHETIRQENELRRTAFNACNNHIDETTLQFRSATDAEAIRSSKFIVSCGNKKTRVQTREVTIVLSKQIDLTTSVLNNDEYIYPRR